MCNIHVISVIIHIYITITCIYYFFGAFELLNLTNAVGFPFETILEFKNTSTFYNYKEITSSIEFNFF